MGFKLGQKFIDKCRHKEDFKRKTISDNHAKYGKFYYPNYNREVEIIDGSYNLFNEYGEKLQTYFIRDDIMAHNPYRYSRYFLFDRYNFGLKTHFYSHENMLETMGKPNYRFGLFIESESIVPESYKIFEKYKGIEKDFDLIFTYSAKLLDTLDNARFVPFCSAPWNKNECDDYRYLKKTKNVSILSSEKVWTPLHKYRYELAKKCKKENLLDTFGTFDGGKMVNINDTLNDYRYTIAIENDITPYFFTERITSAFVSQTVPIYIGATEIDKFFNPDGIIKISVKDDIEKILKQCSKEDYESRLPAIKDNYERVKKYFNPNDQMYEKYLKNLVISEINEKNIKRS